MSMPMVGSVLMTVTVSMVVRVSIVVLVPVVMFAPMGVSRCLGFRMNVCWGRGMGVLMGLHVWLTFQECRRRRRGVEVALDSIMCIPMHPCTCVIVQMCESAPG
ncbi:hypothetical protein CGL27_38940 [Streptomyces sp. 11-1-2]|nr:hypothetical protein CGL27_38940 [Streptomyces sp. 11-1-2]